MISTKDTTQSLKDYFHDREIKINDFIEISIGLAEELANIHSNNIIHRDINTANIMINATNKKAFFKQSVISIKANSEMVHNKSLRLQGNLQYISPEQTGLVNRPFDFRSDLYSLGAVFYVLLSGKPPFCSEDPAELLHASVAIKPVSPHDINVHVPERISAIVSKLLAKTPNDRYQSAFGLLVDLKRCQKQFKKYGEVKSFALGKNDISAVFKIHEKLYGREDESTILQTVFSKVKNVNSQILMISGPPGIGKTFLVNETRQKLVKMGGFFTSGKFDQYKRDIPYKGFIDIFRHLIRRLLGKTSKEIELFKTMFINKLGINAQIIMDVIPELELIIGKQNQVEKLPADESRNRFHYIFQNFIKIFVSKSYPLIFFFDDLQWADTASLELIEAIFSDSKLKSIMFIGTFREIEAEKNLALMTIIPKLQNNIENYHSIKLKPVNEEYVSAVLKNTLLNNSYENSDLVNLIIDKTSGNPLFIKEFLINLYKKGCITFNYHSKVYHGSIKHFGWQVNMEKIASVNLPDSVVDIRLARIIKLPHFTVEILKLASCIGLDFSLMVLSKIAGNYVNQLTNSLEQAIDEGLIIKKVDKFMFSHDKIQEVIYNLIDEIDKETNHYSIGKLLLNEVSRDKTGEDIYTVLHQLNKGKRRLNDAERNTLIDFNLKAGMKAIASTAYDAAVHYLYQGIALLSDNSWATDYQSTFAYYLELSEAEYRRGNFKEADRLFALILHATTSLTDRLKVYELQLDCYSMQLRHNEVLNTAKSVLKESAFSLPTKIGKMSVLKEKIKIWLQLNKKDLTSLINLPTITEPEIVNLINIMVKIADAVYSSNPYLFEFLVFRGLGLSLKYGHCQGTAYFYSSVAALCCQPGITHDLERGYQLSKLALNLNNKFYSRSLHIKILYNNIFVTHWKEPLINCLDNNQQMIDLCFTNGSSQYLYLSSIYYSTSYLLIGKTFNETVDMFNQSIEQIKKKTTLNLNSNFLLIKQVLNNQSKETRDGLFLASFYLSKIFNYYLYNDYKNGLDLCKKEQYFTDDLFLSPTVPIYYFFYALLLAADYANAKNKPAKITYYYKLMRIKNKFKKWAHYNKSTYYLMYTLISAEIARINNKNAAAVNLYKETIELTKENGFLYCQAVALECTGKFYYAQEMISEASHYINESYNCYKQWGASTKLMSMTEKHADLIAIKKEVDDRKVVAEKAINTKSPPYTCSLATLDLQSINEAFNLISSEDDVNNSLKNLLKVLTKKSGAEKTLLLLEKNDRLCSELECLADKKEIRATVTATCQEKRYPELICRYVMRVKETVLLSNANKENRFIDDAYFLDNKPKSIVCMPVIWQTRLFAVIYMENNNLTNLFTLNRHEVFKNIVNQIAMLLENAQQKNIDWIEQTKPADEDILLKEILKNDYKFSNQEINVTLLLKEGYNREQICKILNIAYNTLRCYLKWIYDKTINSEIEDYGKVGRVDKLSRLITFLNRIE